jgi:hypothetical protein
MPSKSFLISSFALFFSWFHTFRNSVSTLSTKECVIFKHPIERVERIITAYYHDLFI